MRHMNEYNALARRDSGEDWGDDEIIDPPITDEDYICTQCGEEIDDLVGTTCTECANKGMA